MKRFVALMFSLMTALDLTSFCGNDVPANDAGSDDTQAEQRSPCGYRIRTAAL